MSLFVPLPIDGRTVHHLLIGETVWSMVSQCVWHSLFCWITFCRTHYFCCRTHFCRIYLLQFCYGNWPASCLKDTSMWIVLFTSFGFCLYRSKSSTLPAELLLDDWHTLPPLCVDCSVHTFQIGFCLSNLLACLYRLKLLRSLFLWQSCFSMVGIIRHLRELFCSHLSDWIFLSVASDTCFLHVSLDFSVPCTLFTWNSDWNFLSVASDTCFLHVSLDFSVPCTLFTWNSWSSSLFLWQSWLFGVEVILRDACSLDFSVRCLLFTWNSWLFLAFWPSSGFLAFFGLSGRLQTF